jgi:CsoR family transcriptional regulator, copper-sensing transcriptional repressor
MTSCTHDNSSKITSLKKAKSHIEKIINMLENDAYCVDVMQQNLAVIGILKSFHQMLMESHLKSCFSDAMKTANNKKKDEMIEEILRVTRLLK